MMDIRKFKAAVFDFDGTIVDSMNLWTEIDIEYLARYGHGFSEDLQKHIEGMSTDEMAVYFRNTYGIPRTNEEMKRDWTEMSIEKYLYEVQLKPGVLEFLQLLKEYGIRTAIATSTEKDILLPFLKKRNLTDYFDAFATTTEAGKGKPEPGVFLLAAERIRTDPKHCIAFEDLPLGILSAKNAGMFTVGVDDSYSRDRISEKIALSDHFIRDYRELYGVNGERFC